MHSHISPFKAYCLRDAPTGLTFNNLRSAHTVFMYFVFIWRKTATCATYSINWLVFITEIKSVCSAVRTGSLNKAVWASKLGNACYHSVQNLLSSRLLSKNLKIKIYRTIILPVVLYGCETWSLTLREERRLRVFEDRVLRKLFGPKRDEVTGEWKKLHNEELNDLYSLPNIVRVVKSRRMWWTEHVTRMGEDRGVHRVLVGKPEGKRPLGRPRRRWEDNIKMDIQDVGGGRGDWMELAQGRDRWRALVGTVRDFRVP